MKRYRILLIVVILMVVAALGTRTLGQSQTPTPPEDQKIRQDADGEIEITSDPATGKPSFIRGHIPFSIVGVESSDSPATMATAFIDRYADFLGVAQPSQELNVVEINVDQLGLTHVTLSQTHLGVRVYGAYIKVHLNVANQEFIAVGSGFVPQIRLSDTNPQIGAEQAIETARMALPGGRLTAEPELVVYAKEGINPGAQAKLAWLVEIIDDSLPSRNYYVVNAMDGSIIDVLDRLYEGRNRETYDANNTYSLPGTLARSEEDDPTGDQDVDNAHQFAGATYDYYFGIHGRDSFDDQGATLTSTAHYGSSYKNAFWNGTQTVYGDDFPVEDVVAHEWTHAVTEHSANLEYRWQSGALNESISDIFGAMVDREDWQMGEDLPADVLGGREAIRDLSDPTQFGQPDHADDWVKTCSDNQGVHTNSGITNKAYYNIATASDKNKAELIFYRALTVYLQPTSTLEDSRAAALQSAEDIYGVDSGEYDAVLNGFNAVGLDGEWQPEANDCVCAVTTTLSGETFFSDPFEAVQVATTLYRLRDQLLGTAEAGQYYRTLYEQNTGRISQLLLLNPEISIQAAQILRETTPGLEHLLDEKGDESIVTEEMVSDVIGFLTQLAQDDRATGGGQLADTIEQEMARIDWALLVGMTFEQAWDYISSRITTPISTIYLPTVLR